jgi:hypothetical protein
MRLYHGSQVENFTPTYGLGDDTHDYGRGFYTTADKELGKEWAVGQRANADGWLHVYEADLDSLKVFDFAGAGVLAWLAELMKHRPADDTPGYMRDSVRFIARYGIDLSGYDVIKGWRADASYYFIARMFVRNQVDVSILGDLLTLGDLGVQYFFKSERAFAALREAQDLKERVPMSEYKARFNARDDLARRRMVELMYDLKRNPLERVFSELVKEVADDASV